MYEKVVLIIARIIITPLFIYSGLGKVLHFSDNVAKTPFGDTLVGQLMIVAAIIIELGGSLCFLTGYRLKAVSIIWIVYVFLTSVLFHQFWLYTGAQQSSQFIAFGKNLSIISGLIYFSLFSPERRQS
ncbi:DoxX family protein [Erwinia sp. S43]|uniref:DoxX family protein n=1 Tax=unclassified Erwinia TaxID=2622719 RepID=UPI00190CF225|nr:MULTISPECIES: DoxX family protein [unclassified Erwinia]MBK0030977.1 DoxX family protein [Erwinia sp. S43]MCW1876285.1 DoxX family protein [Erwinia sp. INIA01]